MKNVSFAALCAVVTVAVVLLSGTRMAEGVTCTVTELSPCLAAITSSAPPSSLCCSKLREQKPCLCGYLRNPNLKQYVNSPNARKVASTCGVPYPNCWSDGDVLQQPGYNLYTEKMKKNLWFSQLIVLLLSFSIILRNVENNE